MLQLEAGSLSGEVGGLPNIDSVEASAPGCIIYGWVETNRGGMWQPRPKDLRCQSHTDCKI